MTIDNGRLRTFVTGATRDTASNKIDPEAFFDPLVMAEFSDYMDRHRVQANGSLRDGDNWQQGFTRESVMKSLWRHFLDLWLIHRGHRPISKDHRAVYDRHGKVKAQREILCALYFNVAAYLREVLLRRHVRAGPAPKGMDPKRRSR